MNSAVHKNNSKTNTFPIEQKDFRVAAVILSGVLLLFFYVLTILQLPSASAHLQLQISKTDHLYLSGHAADRSIHFTENTYKNAPFFFKSVPINFCDREMLRDVKGIGFSLADAIVRDRETRGVYRQEDDLLRVPGIGKSRMEHFRDQFSFTTNLESF